jgi:mRNA interferase RelE/StbE
MAVLGRGELAVSASRATRKRRASTPEGLGEIEARDAAVIEAEGGEILQLRLERPRSREWQLAAILVELEETGGAAVEGMLTPPAGDPEPFVSAGGGALEPRPIPVEEARDRLRRALECTAELDLEVSYELGVCLPLIARGLTGSAEGLPAVEVSEIDEDDLDLLDEELSADDDGLDGDEPGPLYVHPTDDAAFELVEGGLREEFGDYLVERGLDDGAVYEHGAYIAGSALHWKWGYAGGRLGTWTRADLREYMLDHYPRKASSDEETLAAAPNCLAELLGFLDARGWLAGDPLGELLEVIEALVEDIVRRLPALEHPRQIGSALRSPERLWRYRVGDYRIIVEIQDAALVVLVVELGHRREVYRR